MDMSLVAAVGGVISSFATTAGVCGGAYVYRQNTGPMAVASIVMSGTDLRNEFLVRVENIGRGVAYDVSFEVIHPILCVADSRPVSAFARRKMHTPSVIPYLLPGEAAEFGLTGADWHDVMGADFPATCPISVSSSRSPSRWSPGSKRTFVVDLSVVGARREAEQPPLSESEWGLRAPVRDGRAMARATGIIH